MADIPRVVIIGGGFGGLDAARALAGAPIRVTLLDRHNYHLFQPLLYQVATASLSPADVASPIRWILRRQRNVQVLLAEARTIEPDRRRVWYVDGTKASQGPAEAGRHVDQRSIDYDYLIVAAGAAHAYFGHPEWAARAPGLKTLDDALEIRRRVLLAFEAAEREADPVRRARLLTFVIVGGGATGVELAGALAEISRQSLVGDFRSIRPESARIVLLEGGADLLPAFPETLRAAARRTLERLGVEVRTSSIVTDVDHEGVTWRPTQPAASADTETIPAATMLWAAGVAASPLAASVGASLDRIGRVLAEPTLQVPGHPEIFVVGDMCALEQDGRPLPGLAQVAMQGGAHAGRNVLRAIAREPLDPFRYRDYGNAATIGRGAAVVDLGRMKASGYPAWLFWLFLHVFWLVGFRNRLVVMTQWAWAYVTRQRGARLITGGRLSPDHEGRTQE